MATRSADATIRGYYYQFDKTILEILDAAENQTVTVERIEDIDIDSATGTKAIQCKYIPSAKYIYSTIRPPIVLMLDNHIERSRQNLCQIRYHLYAHFSGGIEREISSPVFTLEEFKKLLTFTEQKKDVVYYQDHGISDSTLQEFLKHFTFEGGSSFEDQQANVIKRLRKEFSCNEVDADVLFYNNALRVVRDLAINANIAKRRITKREFVARIDVKKAVFNSWYLELRGEESYCKLIKQKIKLADALGSQHQRMIILNRKYLDGSQQQCLTVWRFIERLVSLYFRRGVSFATVTPLTVVLDASAEQAVEVKRALLNASIVYNDGYEHLEFQPWFFNMQPIVNKHPVGNKASNKLGKSSFQVRLLRAETYRAFVDDINVPDKAILFTDDDPKLYFPAVEPLYLTAHAENLDIVFKILSKD